MKRFSDNLLGTVDASEKRLKSRNDPDFYFIRVANSTWALPSQVWERIPAIVASIGWSNTNSEENPNAIFGGLFGVTPRGFELMYQYINSGELPDVNTQDFRLFVKTANAFNLPFECTDDNIKVYVSAWFDENVDTRDWCPIGSWDVSLVTDMSSLFENQEDFNEDLSRWNVSNVKDMSFMFSGCKKFNQPLDTWKVGNVENMFCMFKDCHVFNGSVNGWNTSNVEVMGAMFQQCHEFNQPVNHFKTSKVTNMSQMFEACREFNQPLDRWNVGQVKEMNSMFYNATSFNQNLDSWSVADDVEMEEMFDNTTALVAYPIWYNGWLTLYAQYVIAE